MRYSNISGSLRWSQGTIILHKGESIADDHPLVTERPELFDTEEPGAQIGGRGKVARVETGVQGPGQMRTERGPRVVPAAPRKTAGNG